MIDRNLLDVDTADDLDFHREWAKSRRERNTEAGQCINQNAQGTHGPREPGRVRCKRCCFVHKYGAELVNAGKLRLS